MDHIRVIRSRIENLAGSDPGAEGSYTVIFARGLSSLEHITRLVQPLLAAKGTLILPRGETVEREWLLFMKRYRGLWLGRIDMVLIPGCFEPLRCLILHLEGSK